MLLRIALLIAGTTSMLVAGVAQGAEPTRTPIVVCTVEKWGDPWSTIARGELTRTKSGENTEYELLVSGKRFHYSLMSPPQSLMSALVTDPPRQLTTPRGPIIIGLGHGDDNQTSVPSHSIGVEVDGSIRELRRLSETRSMVLITANGSACPPAGEGLGPNPAAHPEPLEQSTLPRPSSRRPGGRER